MRKILLPSSLLAVSVLVLLACESKNIDSDQRAVVQQEMDNRELKKLADVDILNAGKEQAAMLADTAQKLLGGTLMSTIQAEGVPAAVSYCNIVAYPLIDSLSKAYGATIKRASLRVRNPKDAAEPWEKEILDAYQYGIENVQPIGENARLDEEKKYVLYTKPIAISNAMCLNCHGTEDQVLPETANKLSDLYPRDNALGHAFGDLRGMWSIKIPVQEIVKKM
ncbi:MAG: DUF3365 domain-containing protein [Bacteroidota bacterium]